MSLLMTPKKRLRYALIFTSSGIIAFWMIWRRWLKTQRKRFADRMNHVREGVVFPGWVSDEDDEVQRTTKTQEMNKAQTCVLYHPYVAIHSRDTCTPNHWHATYWLRFVALVEQEPIRAIVQHTDTKRYHVMAQLPVEGILPCDDCCSTHEVFRLPVRDHYAYFVFLPSQDLDGFSTLQHAQEVTQALLVSDDLLRLLPDSKTNSLL
jgi:hypothetical protein